MSHLVADRIDGGKTEHHRYKERAYPHENRIFFESHIFACELPKQRPLAARLWAAEALNRLSWHFQPQIGLVEGTEYLAGARNQPLLFQLASLIDFLWSGGFHGRASTSPWSRNPEILVISGNLIICRTLIFSFFRTPVRPGLFSGVLGQLFRRK